MKQIFFHAKFELLTTFNIDQYSIFSFNCYKTVEADQKVFEIILNKEKVEFQSVNCYLSYSNKIFQMQNSLILLKYLSSNWQANRQIVKTILNPNMFCSRLHSNISLK